MKPLKVAAAWFASLFGGKASQEKRREETASEEPRRPGPRFAFVCLESADEPEHEALMMKLASWFSVSSAQVKINEDPAEESAARGRPVLSFDVAGTSVMIALLDVPIPAKDIQYACANSLLWPEAAEIVPLHTAHLIVLVHGAFASPADEGLALSRAVAACTECYEAIAVYWGHANTVHEPELFRQEIQRAGSDMNRLPVPMWIGFLRARGQTGGMDLYTSGLNAFGVMEVEVIDTEQRPSEVLGMVSGLAAYLIVSGNVIKDGDTVGGDEDEKIRAHHADSAIGREEKVLRIEY